MWIIRKDRIKVDKIKKDDKDNNYKKTKTRDTQGEGEKRRKRQNKEKKIEKRTQLIEKNTIINTKEKKG